MRSLTAFMHISLDGFVAGTNGEMDWIKVDNEMFELAGERTRVADTALYGRKTFEMMDHYWPKAGEQPNASKHDVEHSTWYNQVEKMVLSRTMQSDPGKKVTVIRDNLADSINALKQKAGGEIVIFGSPGAIHSLEADNLIDEYWLFVNPILLGAGIPLFKTIQQKTMLKLLDHKVFSSGVVCLHYTKQ